MGAQVSIERLFEQIRKELRKEILWELHVSPFPSKGIIPRLRNLWAAWKIGRKGICHITGDVHYLALVLPRPKLVLTIHDCAILHRLRGWRLELIRYLWFECPVRRAAVVTTISEATRDDLRQWLPSYLWGKVRVIPNCVRSEFVPSPVKDDNPSMVFLQVGTGWNKNLLRVAEALSGLACKLMIVGEIDDSQRAFLRSCQLDFECLGRLDDDELVEAYRRCDVLIFASLFEGFGLPILEAQAAGRPVITSNLSPMPEVAGDAALFVNPEDASSIRESVLKVTSDAALRESLVQRGLTNASRFRPEAVADCYSVIYWELAGNGPNSEKS